MLPVGYKFPGFEYVVRETKADEYARAVGSRLSPINDSFEAPLGFVFFVTVQDTGSIFRALGLKWQNVLYGGSEFNFNKPVEVGMTLVGSTEFTCYEEKGSRNRIGILKLDTWYKLKSGEDIFSERASVIALGGMNETT